jgi:SH3-like domain-containing protein
MLSRIERRLTIPALALAIVGAAPAAAAPGDIYRVAHAETVNLRAGPSNESNVRGTVQQGDQVIELSRSDSWLGVRVLRTGEEGWIFGQLLEPVSRSTLGVGAPAPTEDVGFLRWSEGFNRLLASINADHGYPMAAKVEQPAADLLRVVPTPEWLINGSRDVHLMTAVAIYEMWKNHQNGGPVRVVVTDDQGHDYITIVDQDSQPKLSVTPPKRS